MKKNNLNIKNFKFKELYSNFLNNIKVYIDNILMLIFFVMIIVWAFIFYKFAYEVSVTNPKVSVTVLKIKKERLDDIVDDIKKRDETRKQVIFDNIKNPFENNLKKNDDKILEKGNTGVVPERVEQIY